VTVPVSTFLLELGGVALLLALTARLAHRLGLSAIPLYLLVGLAIGEGSPVPLVTARGFIESGATIGLALLLFTLGLEYSPHDLVRTLRGGVAAGVVDLVLNATPGLVAGWLLGWHPLAWLLLAGITYVSSSGVIARLLDELGWLGNREAPLVLGLSVIEDLVMAIFLPLVGIALAGGAPVRLVVWGGLAVALVGGVLALGWRYGERVAPLLVGRSEEGSLMALVALMLLFAGAAEAVNVSAAVGAFLAGIVVAEPAVSTARGLIRPLRHLFAGAFFLFFGLQVDAGAMVGALVPAAVLAGVGVGTKYLTGWVAARRAGLGRRARGRAGWLLVARGEFSIVIAGLGMAAGLEPALGALAGAYVLVLAIVGPVAAHLVQRRSGAPSPMRLGRP
jgi:CPA2 family monovalent cation:H+ antiporter-2